MKNAKTLNTIFYGTLACLILLNSYLLASPGIIGRMGILYYGYNQFRSFPRILAVLTLLSALAIGIDAMFHWFVGRQRISHRMELIFYPAMLIILMILFISLYLDVDTFPYRRTGVRFVAGILMIPWLLIFIFAFRALMTFLRRRTLQKEVPDRGDVPSGEGDVH